MRVCFLKKGQSLFEAIVAIAIFALASTTLISTVIGGGDGVASTALATQGAALADEGLEAMRSIHDGPWNELQYSQGQVAVTGGQWVFNSSASPEIIFGKFSRTIAINSVCRDAGNNIIACPGLYSDPHTKEIVVTVSWQARPGVVSSTRRIAYLSNWDSRDWIQTDWSGGTGQATFTDPTKYNSNDGNIDHTKTGQLKLAKAADGTWSTVNPGIPGLSNAINGISVVSTSDVWAVANSGKFLHYNGSSWSQTQVGSGGLLGIDMVSASDGWAAGDSGKVYRYTGAWSQFQDYGAQQWNSISMTSINNGWIVGNAGNIRRWNGSAWNVFTPSPAITANLNGVFMLSATDGFMVGSQGKVFRWNTPIANQWTAVCTTLGSDIWNSVYMLSASDGWIVGNGGKVLHWDGSTCTAASISPSIGNNLNAVFAVTADDAWAVGNAGRIIRWTGGSSWSTYASPTSQVLRAVAMASPLDGWAVGNSGTMIRFARTRVYQPIGVMTSSAFNMSDASPVQEIEWDQILPVCTPACTIKFQIQTAPNNAGAPGVWSAWTGPDGTASTYFTVNTGTLSPLVLNGKQWVRYQVTLSGDPSSTPVIQEVRINYK